jgi:hypothetical protein
MQLLSDAVATIQGLLQGRLPAPKRGKPQPGFGGWYYRVVPVGGCTPPSGKALLWWLEWYGGGPPGKPGLTREQVERLLSLPPGAYTLDLWKEATPAEYYCLYVAPHRGFQHWWLAGSGLVAAQKAKVGGTLPLIFATPRTGADSIRVQAGIMLWRQGWRDEAFWAWLFEWVQRQTRDADPTVAVEALLRRYRPATHSPVTYVKLWAKKTSSPRLEADRVGQLRERLSRAQAAASALGISEGALYSRLRVRGLYEEMKSTREGDGVAVVRARRRYAITEDTIARLRQEQEERCCHAALVKLVMLRRGVGRRAAQRWVKRRLEAGTSTEEIVRELSARG